MGTILFLIKNAAYTTFVQRVYAWYVEIFYSTAVKEHSFVASAHTHLAGHSGKACTGLLLLAIFNSLRWNVDGSSALN